MKRILGMIDLALQKKEDPNEISQKTTFLALIWTKKNVATDIPILALEEIWL